MPTRHRRTFTEPERAALLARYERSGLPQAEFCRQAGIGLATLSLWRRSRPRIEAGFAEVRMTEPVAVIALHLPGGARLELPAGTDAAWLGTLLRSLTP